MTPYFVGCWMYASNYMAARVWGQGAPYMIVHDGLCSGFRPATHAIMWAICDDFGDLVQVQA